MKEIVMFDEGTLYAVLLSLGADSASCKLELRKSMEDIQPYKVRKEYPHEIVIQLPEPIITIAVGNKDEILQAVHKKLNTPLALSQWVYAGDHVWHHRII